MDVLRISCHQRNKVEGEGEEAVSFPREIRERYLPKEKYRKAKIRVYYKNKNLIKLNEKHRLSD